MEKDNRFNTALMHIYAFLFPLFIMLLLFIVRGIYPFGNESFMRTDMYHQYVPFMSEFAYKLHTGSSLFYTNHIGMGTNFLSIYAYYLASPFNFLLIFVPWDYVIEFSSYMVILKIALSSLSFNYYLSKHTKKSSIYYAFFSMFYALSGFVCAYSWNIMWMDSLILFPLIILAFEKMAKGKGGIQYSIFLALAIMVNYYLAIMICIFLIIYYFAFFCEIKRLNLNKFIQISFKFIIYSILAASLVAFLLVPQIYALKTTASGELDFPKKVEMYFPIIDILVRHLPLVKTHQGLEHYPNIYMGSFVLLFIPLYYKCKNIKLREKIAYTLVLFMLLSSFSINVFNYIWHGFHYPNSLPARNSFIYIFIILYMCFRVFKNLASIGKKDIATSFAISIFFILLVQKIVASEQEIEFYVYYIALAFVSLYAGLLFLYKKAFNRNLLYIFTISLVCIELCLNTSVTSVTTSSREQYLENTKDIRLLIDKIDNPFYRYERISRKTKDDGAFLNFNSVSIFSSTAYADMSNFFKEIGNESSTNAYSITGQSPLFDTLLAVKYGIYEGEQKNPYLTNIADLNNIYIYENPYILPLAFMDTYNIDENWNRKLKNPIERQNDLSLLLTGENILEEIEVDKSDSDISFISESSGQYFAYVSDTSISEINVNIDGIGNKEFENLSRKYLLDLGYLDADTKLKFSTEDNKSFSLKVARFNYDILGKIYEKLSYNTANIRLYEDGHIEASIEAKDSGNLFFSIPYDKSWKIYVDSYPVKANKYLGSFISIPLTKGEHNISLRYEPEGFMLGLKISILALFILMFICLERKFRKYTFRYFIQIFKQ